MRVCVRMCVRGGKEEGKTLIICGVDCTGSQPFIFNWPSDFYLTLVAYIWAVVADMSLCSWKTETVYAILHQSRLCW